MDVAARLIPILKRHWGYDRFRPLQAEAMQAVLEGRDSVVVLPTGGGKSLCYQAPALAMEGLAVVVSPLISLMKDQVDTLQSNGVAAASVNSTHAVHDRRNVADDIRAGRLKLLYISPERLSTEKTLSFLQSVKVSFFAIDEAHCISQWGHDFRPEYRMMSVLKERFSQVAVHAYTATATPQVRTDIADQLTLTDPLFHVGSFDRPNLLYRVEARSDLVAQIREVLGRHKGESGIIYCISRKQTEEIAGDLRRMGLRSAPYHAGLPDVTRRTTQDAFQKEMIDVVVATVAFGMGIDKSNVRFVVHAGAPKSIEHYQQESGRAGRDALEAECCLFYGPGDFIWWRKVADEMPPEVRAVSRKTVKAMEDFCQGVTCRHRGLVSYFGQEFEKENCGACDVCLAELDLTPDAKVVSQKILSCVVRLKESFGAQYTALVLCGSEDQRILENGHNQLSTYGLLKESGANAVRLWIEQLIGQGFCERHGEYQQLRVTPAGWTVLKGETVPRLLQPPKKKEKRKRTQIAADLWEGVDTGLFEELRVLRKTKADEMGVPPFVIFSDQTLREMARYRPTTLSGFRGISGVGEKKLADYGELFTSAIREWHRNHAGETDLAIPTASPSSQAERTTISHSRQAAFALFDEGKSIDEAVQAVGRARSTVEQYLVEYITETGRVETTPWVDDATASRIAQAIEALLPETRLKPVMEHLNGTVSYEQVRVVVACRRNRPEPLGVLPDA